MIYLVGDKSCIYMPYNRPKICTKIINNTKRKKRLEKLIKINLKRFSYFKFEKNYLSTYSELS